jgi:hypothetical protein
MTEMVPQDFTPPLEAIAEEFKLARLEPKFAELDQQAIMKSIVLIRRLRGGTWPQDTGLTVEEDREEMSIHLEEFENRTSFAYIVLNPDASEGWGCVYIYPPNHPFNHAEGSDNTSADAIINMWVSQPAYDRGIYPKLWSFVEQWVSADWPFKNPYFSNPTKPN